MPFHHTCSRSRIETIETVPPVRPELTRRFPTKRAKAYLRPGTQVTGVELFPLQQRRAHHLEGTGRNHEHVGIVYSVHDRVRGGNLQSRRCRFEDRASSTGNGSPHVDGRVPGRTQNGQEVFVRDVLKYHRRDGQSHEDASALGDVDELDGHRYFISGDLGGRHGVCGLVRCHADAQEDCVAVDVCGGRACLHGVHQCAADRHEDTTQEKPGHIVAIPRHQDPVHKNAGYVKYDEWKETYGGLSAGIPMDELKVQRDVVYCDVQRGPQACRADKEQDQRPAAKKLSREEASLFRGEKREVLRHNESDQDQSEDHEEGNDPTVVPRPDGSTKGKDHHECDVDSSI